MVNHLISELVTPGTKSMTGYSSVCSCLLIDIKKLNRLITILIKTLIPHGSTFSPTYNN